jgi:hypothetical protein
VGEFLRLFLLGADCRGLCRSDKSIWTKSVQHIMWRRIIAARQMEEMHRPKYVKPNMSFIGYVLFRSVV